MKTDTTEKGLEALIVGHMTADGGWIAGKSQDYERSYAIDVVQLSAFIAATQSDLVEALDLDNDTPARQKFLARAQGEITKRGVIDVLRHGVKHGPHTIEFFFATPTPGNAKAEERYGANRFSVTRQLRYSTDETLNALDLGLFINGLPISTFELKNSLTKQTVDDAVEQYKRDRNPRELLFQFGRCIAHLAVDDSEVRYCTYLKGKASWFLPFNKGWNDGAGNPPNPDGIKTDYLWKQVLSARSTGQPCEERPITCDATEHLPNLEFPAAEPRVMLPKRTFWEKATAVHVFCKLGTQGDRLSRHWHDLVRLDDAGYADAAFEDRALANEVAEFKGKFFRTKEL
jgi:type I restriction enzyme, R subunit